MRITADNSFSLKPFTAKNLAQALIVYRQCEDFLALGPQAAASLAMVQQDFAAARAMGSLFCGIYQADNRLIGIADYLAAGYKNNPRHAYLALLMIGKPLRGLGIGTKIVGLIEQDIMKNPRITTILSGVQVNNPLAIKFWQHRGYSIYGGPELLADQTTVHHLRKELQTSVR